MTMKLTAAEAALLTQGAVADTSQYSSDFWSKSEKKFTKYLRKRQNRPKEGPVNPRLLHIPQEHCGILFGRSRERLKALQEKYGGVRFEIVADGVVQKTPNALPADEVLSSPRPPSQRVTTVKIIGGVDEDLPFLREEFVYAEEHYPVQELSFVIQSSQLLKQIAQSTRAQISIENQKGGGSAMKGSASTNSLAVGGGAVVDQVVEEPEGRDANREKEAGGSATSSSNQLELLASSPGDSDAGRRDAKGNIKSRTSRENRSKPGYLRVRGPRQCVILALQALDTHFMYFDIAREMDAMMQELNACKQGLLAEMKV